MAALQGGTLSVLDTLAANRQTIVQYGEDNAYADVAALLAAHNTMFAELIDLFCEPTTALLDSYGGSSNRSMQELDEFGNPDPQKMTQGIDVGYPLRKYGDALQWTRDWMRVTTMAELVAEMQDIFNGDKLNAIRQIKTAIYTPTNTTFLDRLIRRNSLPVKALLNNDGTAVPVGPNGETFATSHNHYLANAGYTEAYVLALIATVLEHRRGGKILLLINGTEEAATRAFTNFKPVLDMDVVPASTTSYVRGALDMTDPNDRYIGKIGAAQVWVKPYIETGYPIAVRSGLGRERALGWRTRENDPVMGELRLVSDHAHNPLQARSYEREFGVGVKRRDMAAVLDSINAAYTMPTIS